jgi:hypothetical protein
MSHYFYAVERQRIHKILFNGKPPTGEEIPQILERMIENNKFYISWRPSPTEYVGSES